MDDDRKAKMKDVILQCNSLAVGYSDDALVSNINFEVNSGEIVSIIGVNGAGKSTLLKTVAGLLPAIDGNVFFDRKDLLEIPSKDRAKNLSILLTDKINADYMTCYDVVATGRYAYTNGIGLLSKDDKEAILEAMKAIDIESIQDKLFIKLSDGQKQRVMLARAICQKPKMIILDEPTSFLDIGYKIEIMSILKEMANNNIAVLMTMHDLDIAKKVSDKVISIKDGKIDRIDTPDEMINEKYLCQLFGVESDKYKEFYG